MQIIYYPDAGQIPNKENFNVIYVNTRNIGRQQTGVQRYTSEILRRIGDRMLYIAPDQPLPGGLGHAWEQSILPFSSKSGLLWSPGNTGPILLKNQVVTIHDTAALDHPEWFNPRFASWYRFMLPRLAKRVRKIITVSEFSKERMLALFKIPENRVICIPNGVSPTFYPKKKDEISAVGKALGLPSCQYILSLGSLEPRKNLNRLLQAWHWVINTIDRTTWLVVAGASADPSIFQNLEELKRLPPRVHFIGHVPDKYLPALYSGAIAFAYLSQYEGFGLPPLESMAAGTPTVVADHTSLPEVIGNAGVMVNPYDVGSIAEGLYQLIKDTPLRTELTKKGLSRARLFSWDRAAEKTLKVLQAEAQA